jgi:hypothetical protein
MKPSIIFSAAMIAVSLTCWASFDVFGQFLDNFLVEKPNSNVEISFFGLNFMVDKSTTTCRQEIGLQKLVCEISLKNQNLGIVHGEMSFAGVKIPSNSLPLLRLKRKQDFLANYFSKFPIIEENIEISSFSTRLQKFKYYLFDNIFRPVLIRAFDVVVDDKTIVSVTTKCNETEWPILESAIKQIELSLVKVSR